MVRIFEIDLDREKIFVQDEWLALDELSARLRDKIDQQDFADLSVLSEALERLQTVLSEAHEMTIRVTREVADSYRTIAEKSGEPLEQILRRVLSNYLTSADASQYLFDGAAEPPVTPPPAGGGLTSLADLEAGDPGSAAPAAEPASEDG